MMKNETALKSQFFELSQKDFLQSKYEIEQNLKKQIEQNEIELEILKSSYEQRLASALAKSKEINKIDSIEKSKTCAHLSNINPDPMLTGSLKYLIEFKQNKKKIIIGSDENSDIQLNGVGILDKHAYLKFKHNEFFITPFSEARLILNGKEIVERIQLNNFDRVVLGASSYYLFVDPRKFEKQNIEEMNQHINNFKIEQVQEEIAAELGLMSNEDKTNDEINCFNDLIDIMPLVEEANGMSAVLDKKMKYEPVILNPLVLGEHNAASQVKKSIII
jgi:hypothetical protein